MSSFAFKSCSRVVRRAGCSFGELSKAVLHYTKPSTRQILASATSEDAVSTSLDDRRTSVYVLSAVMLVLLSLSIVLNLFEGSPGLLPPLTGAAVVAAGCILWTYRVGTHTRAQLFILNFTLMCVGLFLFLRQAAPDGSSLFWFIVFPPMVMVSLGLRHGSAVFSGFYLVLFLLLFTPLDQYLVHAYSRSIRIRFMLAMFGAFFFSWWVEYLRYKTYHMLVAAMTTLERDSLTDHLTGLANRRDFYNTFSRVLADCRRKGEPYVLAFLDIDHFKRVNDLYGHPVGDMVLRHIATVVSQQIRETDRTFRWGGEEFAILMPACTQEQGVAIAERIRRHVESSPFLSDGSVPPLSMTISIGLYCGMEMWDAELPIKVADAYLYAAKKLGRNRVVYGERTLVVKDAAVES